MKALGFDQNKVKKIAILGLAFKGKPPTDDLRGSMVRPIMNALMNNFPNAEIYGYDALVKEMWARELGLQHAPSLEDAFQDAQIVIIQNNHSVFSAMDIGQLALLMNKPGLIYDYWNQFTRRGVRMPDGVYYTGLGSMTNALIAAGVKKG